LATSLLVDVCLHTAGGRMAREAAVEGMKSGVVDV
jgi:hypothetical protein